MPHSMTTPDVAQSVTQRIRAAAQLHLRGEDTVPLYLATAHHRRALATLDAVVADLRAAEYGERLLVCTGQHFARLWHDTLRRGMTPFIRRALATRHVVLLAGVEVLRAEPFAQAELARLVTPSRLIVLIGCGHLRHVVAWSPILRPCLRATTCLYLHEGPCGSEADAWEMVGLVAGYAAQCREFTVGPGGVHHRRDPLACFMCTRHGAEPQPGGRRDRATPALQRHAQQQQGL